MPSTPNNNPFTGTQQLQFCQRLGDSWIALATILEIPSVDQRRFTKGDEPYMIWEWLEIRRRLSELPAALDTIGRSDLAELLRHD